MIRVSIRGNYPAHAGKLAILDVGQYMHGVEVHFGIPVRTGACAVTRIRYADRSYRIRPRPYRAAPVGDADRGHAVILPTDSSAVEQGGHRVMREAQRAGWVIHQRGLSAVGVNNIIPLAHGSKAARITARIVIGMRRLPRLLCHE